MSCFYVTTPIYYVNDHPHIGHIYTTIVADTVARYRRLRGDDVYFLTGTDEHGQKIERAAAERGVEPIALADEVVARYHELWRTFGMSHDDFIRTSEPRHAAGVRVIIERMAAQGDFYVDRHEGLYCVRCETFYTEKELLDGGLCPVHEAPVEERSEENLFFRLSKYEQPLLDLYDRHPDFVRPASRLNEVRQFVSQGLRDLSVSRTSVDWAVPFPGHEGHTVYVWLDALTNYISALGFGSDDTSLYDRFWAGDDARAVHLVGKDILRFHAVYWPAFLLSAGLPLPNTVWAHGWWLRDDRKVSKSSGAVVRPEHLIERFGGDALRFYLLRDMAFGQDAGFSDEAFIERFNGDLANDLGNTVSRLVTLARRAFDGLPPETGDGEDSEGSLRAIAAEAVETFLRRMDEFAFHQALDALWRLQQEMSQYLVRQEPWKKLKDESARAEVSRVLWSCMEATRIVTTGLLPVLPEVAPNVLRALGALGADESPPTDLEAALQWGGLAAGGTLPAVEPLFPRIDKKAYLAEIVAAREAAQETQSMSESAEPDTSNASVDAAAASTDSSTETSVETPAEADPRIQIDHFFEVVLKVATVQAAEAVPKSKKLLKLQVEIGEDAPRTVVAGIAKQYAPEDLVGRQVVVVANLQPAKLMGIESNGMVLAATEDGQPVLLHPERRVPDGTRVS
ncbi:MAG: methionine--tRNA ligase [Acidobacteriota bacterium]